LYSKLKDVNENDGPTFAWDSQYTETPTAGCCLHPGTQLQATVCSTGGSNIPYGGSGITPGNFLKTFMGAF